MKELMIGVRFADPAIKVGHYKKELTEGLSHADLNLRTRHRTRIEVLFITDESIMLRLHIPDELYDGYNIGNHLRGVSRYLLENYSYEFKSHRVGTRLLQFWRM